MNISYSSSSIYQFFLAMRAEIDRHKWLESEKAGYDVGVEFAMIDWMMNHKSEWKFHYIATQTPTSSFRKSG